MKYVVLLAADPAIWDAAGPEERRRTMAAHDAFDAEVQARGAVLGGEALDVAATATTVRHDHGDRLVVTDGPYVELVEQLGGFYVVELPDLDAAVAACALLPDYYAVEIRPVLDLGELSGT
ncbi:MAG: YciI family protein [Phycicoccus sp.]